MNHVPCRPGRERRIGRNALIPLQRRLPVLSTLIYLLSSALVFATDAATDAASGTATALPLRIAIEGLSGSLLENAKAYLTVMRLDEKPITDETQLKWLHSRAETDIQRSLQPFGYYQAAVTGRLQRTASHWQATYSVELGPPVRIATVDVQVTGDGETDRAFQDLLKELPLHSGQILNHAVYEQVKQQLQRLATEHGYFDARWEASEIKVDLATLQAAVRLHWHTGRQYRFGAVRFSETLLSPRFLQRYVQFHPDDPYQANTLLELQSALVSSDYFSQVNVNAPLDKAEDYRIPIEVDLAMQDSHRYSIGAGYGTDTGIRGRGSWEKRYWNEDGYRSRAELLASQIKYSVSGELLIPGTNPITDLYSIRAGYTREDSQVKDSSTGIVGISWKQQFDRWQRIISLDYSIESFRFDERQTTRLLMPSIGFTRLQADNRLNIQRGSRLHLELRGAYAPLLSDLSFLQAIGRIKIIQPLGERGRLLARSDVGISWLSDFEQLPASVRFFAGGDNSVRGYALDKIGPEDDQGNIVGGKYLVTGSVEYEHRILPQWSLALFTDAGDAFDVERPDFKIGVGFGVRWHSPIGPIRVDMAHALQRTPGDTIRLHLMFGPEF